MSWAQGRAAMAAALALLLVAGCAAPRKPGKVHQPPATRSEHRASTPPRPSPPVDFNSVRDSAPASVPDVSRIPEPVPRDEPLARYGNKSPYTVLGRTYEVMSESAARRYRERGLASWYGTKFHGRLTSSREPYDMYTYTGAHKSLPLPAFVRVHNLDNGRSLVVRVNDRGPFHPGRIIDLSYAAAIKLGVDRTGTARVEVETIGPRGRSGRASVARSAATPARAEPSSARTPAVHRRNDRNERQDRDADPRIGGYLQVGSFASIANAHRLRDRLQDAGIGPVRIDSPDGSRVLHRVGIGPIAGDAEFGAIERRLRSLGLTGVRVR